MPKKSMKLGGGGRFQALAAKIDKEKGYSREDAKAAAAAIGRSKYGKGKFQKMAAKGRMRHAMGK